MIRLWNDKPEDNTLLLDTTPQTKTPSDNHSGENVDEALSDGESFMDQVNKVKITQTSHDDISAILSVEFFP